MYDSRQDTIDHIYKVMDLLDKVVINIENRAAEHDASKLKEPEKSMYDEFTPKLRELTYGSDEYKECLKKMGVALKHHYADNSHHPEHYEYGINDMSLLDIIEMIVDWKAATLRHADGNIHDSLRINKERFKISDQLQYIIINTIKEMGW